MRSIAIAVSGGADSLYAAALLVGAGRDVLAVHAHFLPPGDGARADEGGVALGGGSRGGAIGGGGPVPRVRGASGGAF